MARKRATFVHVRISMDEQRLLKRKAAESGKTQSDFLRDLAFGVLPVTENATPEPAKSKLCRRCELIGFRVEGCFNCRRDDA